MSKPKRNKFQIILTSNGRRIKTLYNCASEHLANEKFKELVNDNKSVKFPVKYINMGKLVDAHYEIYIVKYDDDAPKATKLKNENGKIINFETDHDGWIVYDREDYNKEETFWVYGYHPTYQRKDFDWIYNELLAKGASKYDMKQVFVFQNKLLIATTYSLEFVNCKNKSDCVRLYNYLEYEQKERKDKYIFFSGDAYNSKLRKQWFKRLMDLTGWSHHKLSRNSLRP